MASLLDWLWPRVIAQESMGNPAAISPRGAFGVSQLMPATASDPGFGVAPLNPSVPGDNERMGRDYLTAMLSRYGGNPARALVAYNWGPGHADKWSGNLDKLPRETLGYIKSILGGSSGPESPMMLAGPQQPSQQDESMANNGLLTQDALTGRLGGLLGNKDWRNQIGPALLALGAGIAGGANRGWGPGIGAGLAGAQDAIQNQQELALKDSLLKQKQSPTFGVIGEDAYGNKQYGFADPGSMTVTPVRGSSADQQTQGQDLTTGEDFLKTLPKPMASQVKALAEGKMAFPSGYALKSGYWQKMLENVSQYDPSFDSVNFNARSKTRSDFTSGGSAKQINAMNTVIGHLQSLSDAATKLGNTAYPAWNSIKNYASTQVGNPEVKNFDTTKKAVVDELTRVWRQSGGSEQDIATWSQNIDAAGSPEQLHNVIGQIGDLLESKISSMKAQYDQGMGTSNQGVRLLTPESDRALSVLRSRSSGQDQSATAPEFSSEAEAYAAEKSGALKKGTKIIINGQPGTWQ
jgi:hypothetical protein